MIDGLRFERELDRAYIARASANTHAFWGEGLTLEEHQARAFVQLEKAGPLLRYAGLVDAAGELVASMKRYDLALRDLEGVVHRAIGVGAVFTPEARRGRGYASALLCAVLDEGRAEGYGAAFLYSDVAPPIYERLGFHVVDVEEHAARRIDLPAKGALATRPATDGDRARLLELFDASFTEPRLVHVARTLATHRFFTWRNRTGDTRVLVEDGRDVGYVLASPVDLARDLPPTRDPRALWLDEWSAPGVPRERVLATVRAIAEELGAERVEAWLPPAQRGAPFVAARRAEAIAMIAPLAPSFAFDPSRAFLSAFEHF